MQEKHYKITSDSIPISASAGAISLVIDLQDVVDLSISLKYGVNGGGSAQLFASNNGTDYSEITTAALTLDAGGGYQVWNLVNFRFKYLKLTSPAATSSTVEVVD